MIPKQGHQMLARGCPEIQCQRRQWRARNRYKERMSRSCGIPESPHRLAPLRRSLDARHVPSKRGDRHPRDALQYCEPPTENYCMRLFPYRLSAVEQLLPYEYGWDSVCSHEGPAAFLRRALDFSRPRGSLPSNTGLNGYANLKAIPQFAGVQIPRAARQQETKPRTGSLPPSVSGSSKADLICDRQ